MIVCLGWGSLIWDHGDLPISDDWSDDGPSLPVEFARQSGDGRITLVITDGSEPVPVFWVRLEVDRLDDARHALAKRERISLPYIEQSVGYWSKASRSAHTEAGPIGEWADGVRATDVVWTALKPRFDGKAVIPSSADVVAYLSGLTGEKRRRAEEYIRRAPPQIRTPHRREIEHELNW